MKNTILLLTLLLLAACGGGAESAPLEPSGIFVVSEPGTGPGGAIGWTTGTAPTWTIHVSESAAGCGTQVVAHELGRILGLQPTSTVGCVMRPVCDPAWIVCPGEAAAAPSVTLPVRLDVTHPLAVAAIGASQAWNNAAGRLLFLVTP